MEILLKLCKIQKYYEQDCPIRVVELRQDGSVETERGCRVRNGMVVLSYSVQY